VPPRARARPIGNQSNASADGTNPRRYLIRHPQHPLDENNATRGSNWVSWQLGLADLGSSGRGQIACRQNDRSGNGCAGFSTF
jgi:hypothetical protein